MKNLIKLSRGLSRVKRFQVYNLFNTYNVAEHSYRIAMLCYIIGKDIDRPTQEHAMTKALFHDLEEGILGDFPGPLKKRNTLFHREYDKLAHLVMSEELGCTSEYAYWSKSKSGPSGEIVYLADNLEAFITVVEEVEAGNRAMLSVLRRFYDTKDDTYPSELVNKYPTAKEILDDLVERTEKELK